jgi:UDP-N-acetylmuramate--alanine ligase
VIDINNIQTIYFIGIGGIGMSNLARYFAAKGATVGGYDKTPTTLTQQLEAEGMAIHYTEDVALIPKEVDLVVYTPAIPAQHAELVYYQQQGQTMLKRSQVLGAIMQHSFSVGVSGTHGKTTTTTMLAHILRHSGYGCNAFLGGIAVNYNSNFWTSDNPVCVAEADEYDRSFLQLNPDIAIITSMDADHLDIYGTVEAMEQAFVDFSCKIKPGGLLVSKYGLKRGNELTASQHITYSGTDTAAMAHAANITMQAGSYYFDVVLSGQTMGGFALHMGGMHNVENVVAAIAVAHHLQIDAEKIKAAVADFKGVKRRFEYMTAPAENPVLIDDYAHHPEELRALITGAKGLFPDKRCTVIFQPHLYSRTNDLAGEFAQVLDLADEVVLLPIYPARELPMPGVSSEMIRERMKLANKQVIDKEGLLEWLAERSFELVITAGAGDIDTLVLPIKEILTNRKQ